MTDETGHLIGFISNATAIRSVTKYAVKFLPPTQVESTDDEADYERWVAQVDARLAQERAAHSDPNDPDNPNWNDDD